MNLKERYVLGFTPSNLGEPGSYHRLLVTFDTAERCPKCQIQARTGYYAGAQDGTAANAGVPAPPWPAGASPGSVKPAGIPLFNRPADMEEALAQNAIFTARNYNMDLDDILFDVSAAEERDAKGRPQVKIGLQINAANVLFKIADDRHVGRLRITVFYADSKGKSLGADWKIMDLRLTEQTYQQMLRRGIPYSTTIPLKIPGQRIKVVVYDPGSVRLGSRLAQIK